MRKKGILAAFTTACLSACLGICTLNVSASVTYADLFETQGLTVTENVSGATLKNAAEVILYPNEDKTGMGLTTATGTAGTVALKEKSTGAFEVDFRLWSQTNGTADVESVVWKFDDGTNSFTVNFIPANEWNNAVPGVTVSINDDTTDKFCYYYTTTWDNSNGYVLNSYRCAGVSTPIYGSSFTNSDNVRFLPGTNQSLTKSISTVFGFSPETMEIYTYIYNVNTSTAHKVTVWKLNEMPASFSGATPTQMPTISSFGAYDVTMTITPTSGAAANMVMYSLNGNSLAVTDGTGDLSSIFSTDNLTVQQNVNGTSLKNGSDTVLYTGEDKIGFSVATSEGGTGTLSFKSNGAFEADFRVWSQTNGTADVESVVWKFDDGTNSFTVNFIPANEWNNTVPGVTVSVNDDTTDKFCYYYTTTWNTTGYNLNSYRCAGVSTAIYGSSFTNSDNVRFLPGTNQPLTKSISTVFGFSPETMEIYTYIYNVNTSTAHKVTVWKLNEMPASFSGAQPSAKPRILSFGDVYNVTMTVNAASGKTGKAVIYSINGTSMQTQGNKLSGVSKPVIEKTDLPTYLQEGTKFTLPVPEVFDFLCSETAFNGTVAVYLDDSPVALEGLNDDGTFKEGCNIAQVEEGEYKIVYTLYSGETTSDQKTYYASCYRLSNAVYSNLLTTNGVATSTVSESENALTDEYGTVLFPSSRESGVVISMDGQNGSFAFTNPLSGTFEMDFRVWSDVTASYSFSNNYSECDSYNLRELRIKFDDGTDSFTLVICGGDKNWISVMPTAYVCYGDSTDKYAFKYNENTGVLSDYRKNSYGTWLFGSSFLNVARGLGTWLDSDKTQSIKVGFDPQTLEVYAYALNTDNRTLKKYTIWQLNQKQTNWAGYDTATETKDKLTENQPVLETFGSTYTVTVSMTAQEGKTARMLLKSVNGQTFACDAEGKIYNTAGPRLSKKVLVAGVRSGEAYTIPKIVYTDILNGENVTVQGRIIAPNGTDVSIERLGADGELTDESAFTPVVAGEYTFEFFATDRNGTVSETKSLKFIVSEPSSEVGGGGNTTLPEPNDPPQNTVTEIDEPNAVIPETPQADDGDKGKTWIAVTIGAIAVAGVTAGSAVVVYKKKRVAKNKENK